MIKHLVTPAALIAAMLTGSAHASTVVDFDYTFTDGLSIQAEMTGTWDGTNLTNATVDFVNFNNNQFSGTLSLGAYSSATSSWDYSNGAAKVSATASANNFIIADSTDPQGNGVTNYLYFVNGTTPSGTGTSELFAVNANTGDVDLDNPATGTLTVAAVPLPGSVSLLASSLGLLTVAVRRRRVSAAV